MQERIKGGYNAEKARPDCETQWRERVGEKRGDEGKNGALEVRRQGRGNVKK